MQSHQVGISVAFARGYARPVATARDRGRCRERLEGLSESSLDCDSLQRETIVELQGVIGFDRWCWAFSDPDSLVPLGGLAEHDYGPAVARSLELEYSGGDFATMSALSRRERRVVAALLAGLDTRAVSARLCISRHTVQDHLKSVFKKTGAHSRRELLARFSGASDPASPPPL